MLQRPERISFLSQPDNRAMQNQPTSTADAATEEMAGDADEPPDPLLPSSRSSSSATPRSQFQKSTYPSHNKSSLLTQMIHTSESDSHVDEDDYAFYEPTRARSNASTYSRSSAMSIPELTSSTGHTSPHTNSPSPPPPSMLHQGMPPLFKHNTFQATSTNKFPKVESVAPTQKVTDDECEQAVQVGLGRKRCITFACASKDATKPDAPKRTESAMELSSEKPRRNCSLTFMCPGRNDSNATKPRVRLTSPPPPVKRSQAPPATARHRGSDATLRTTNSPKAARKPSPVTFRPRRDSLDSDVSRSEATRFHEFASSEEEVDDWTKESGCFERRLTIDDTLAMENDLRKIGREAEEEDENENEEDLDDEEDQDEDEDEDDEDIDQSVHSGYISDEGFRTDDEEGFAQSDDESDGDSDYDWWAPGRIAVRENLEQMRPSPRPRRSSESSTESGHNGIPISPHLQRKRSRPMKPGNNPPPPPELPDSTDFVCGTLDEDKPLEQAYIQHLEQRRAAKHKAVPQDIDPTFPASDPELDDEEEDEVSDHAQTESDHPMFFHGPDDLHDGERVSHRLVPKKRSPIPSPRRLRSPPPPPSKRATVHRSPPPPARRARSPAPFLGRLVQRLSSSVPRRGSQRAMHQRFKDDVVDEDQDDTPRFNRRAVDIVMGLEKKRERRREKMHEKHCRKAAKKGEKKPIQKGKGAERMRDLGIGLNEYRGRKTSVLPRPDENGEVHMLSY